jgi:hypothetical protein
MPELVTWLSDRVTWLSDRVTWLSDRVTWLSESRDCVGFRARGMGTSRDGMHDAITGDETKRPDPREAHMQQQQPVDHGSRRGSYDCGTARHRFDLAKLDAHAPELNL